MNPQTAVVSGLLIAVAYLVGAIPFGYLVAKGLGGIDIRTVGSGNIGATNVGRVLGFRYFVLVFALDLAKGLFPTWCAAPLVAALTGYRPSGDLAVLVALATILGHNFPVYLRFKGGKGVATSLGALLALDQVAAGAAAVSFVVFLTVSRYVSVSSVGGGLVFVLVHFLQVAHPWGRGERAMTAVTVALLALLVVRHRKNFARLAKGTEPKVSLRKKSPPAGRASVWGVVALGVVSLAAVAVLTVAPRLTRRDALTIGRVTLAEVDRAGTGHQRAERVAFADGGRRLAVTCPRYNRLVIYRVAEGDRLEVARDLTLDGRPVAVCAGRDRLYVLERPPGDERHIRPGWWEAFDFGGGRIGDRVPVGYYPDDMALAPDERHLFVLNSGRAEGSADRPAPALEVYPTGGSGPVGRVTFDDPADDPARLTLSESGRAAAVTLRGSESIVSVDLTDPETPRRIGRSALAGSDRPYVSRGEGDAIVMPVANGREAVTLAIPGVGTCLAGTLPRGSGLEFYRAERERVLGRLTLHAGAFGLGSTRPTGLAFSPERGLIAVANRSGGVHLVAVRAAEVAAVAGREVTARR